MLQRVDTNVLVRQAARRPGPDGVYQAAGQGARRRSRSTPRFLNPRLEAMYALIRNSVIEDTQEAVHERGVRARRRGLAGRDRRPRARASRRSRRPSALAAKRTPLSPSPRTVPRAASCTAASRFLAFRRDSTEPSWPAWGAACAAPGAARADEVLHLLPRVLEVAVLVARALAGHEQPPLGVAAASRPALRSRVARVVAQALDAVEVDAQLDLGRDLVDVLPARARTSG